MLVGREGEEEVNRQDSVALTLSPPPRATPVTPRRGAANQRAGRSGCGSPPRSRVSAAQSLVCMCVSVRVCVSECEQVAINIFFIVIIIIIITVSPHL